MSSLASVLRGAQLPRLSNIPAFETSAGEEAIEVGRIAGITLDPWQEYVLINSLGERADGRWQTPTVGLCVARQNGKNVILGVRQLAGIFAFGEKLVVHSAHEQKTANEHFRWLLAKIEGVPEFDARVLKVSRGKGSEAIELRDGQRILFNTRSGSAFRGFKEVDLIAIDEAMIFDAESGASLGPTQAALSMDGNPQIWWTGSAVDALNTQHRGLQFSNVRTEALAGYDRVAWFEWSAPFDDPDDLKAEDLVNREFWAVSNPGLGIRISEEYIENERRTMLLGRHFPVERLSIGFWEDLEGSHIISLELWQKLMDPKGKLLDPLCFAFDVSPDRAFATISSAGNRPDGDKKGIEVVMHGPGTGWVVPQLTQLHKTHNPAAVLCDATGPAGSLVHELEQQNIEVTALSARDYSQACGTFYDLAVQERLSHLGTPELAEAIQGATKRPLGDAWAWDRKRSSVDISPLCASTIALWGHLTNDAAEPWMEAW
jgi:hypothetical protein